MGAAVELSEGSWQTEVLGSSQPVLVDFWSPSCPPCRAIAPVIDQLAAENQGSAKVAKVNVDYNQQLAQQYGIQAIPTLIIFKNGKIVDRMLGAQPKGRLQQAIDAAKV